MNEIEMDEEELDFDEFPVYVLKVPEYKPGAFMDFHSFDEDGFVISHDGKLYKFYYEDGRQEEVENE